MPALAPELLLRQATLARTSDLRAKYARRGLERGRRLDPTMRAMLLRQLYLSLLEQEKFDEALRVATESFVSKGYRRTRVDALIRELGISPSVFYSHFASKRHLLVEHRWYRNRFRGTVTEYRGAGHRGQQRVGAAAADGAGSGGH